MTLRSLIQSLAREFDAEDNAAFDLWSWLPSYKTAEAAHGDRASDFQPSRADIMREATVYIRDLTRGPDPDGGDWYACPCGETHEGTP